MMALWIIVGAAALGAIVFFAVDLIAFHREVHAPVRRRSIIENIEETEWPSTRTPSSSPSYDSRPLTSDATTASSKMPTRDETTSSIVRKNSGWRID